MTGKTKTRKPKTGGSKKPQKGGSLMQSGRGKKKQTGKGILASILPGPLGAIAGMIGLGRPKKQNGGLDPKEYARALIESLGPIVKRDLGL